MTNSNPCKMEDTLPLPYTDEIEVVPGRFCYCLRLTPKGQYSIESVQDFVQENNAIFKKWIYGMEYPDDQQKLHYHFVIYSKLEEKSFRKIVKDFIDPFFPNKKRGYGNAQYNLQIAENPRKAISYALKDLGASEYSGFTEECIEHLRGESFQKESFDSLVINLNKKFQDEDMSDHCYMASYFTIYATFNRSINPSTIYGYLLSAKVNKDKNYAEHFARQYLKRLNN